MSRPPIRLKAPHAGSRDFPPAYWARGEEIERHLRQHSQLELSQLTGVPQATISRAVRIFRAFPSADDALAAWREWGEPRLTWFAQQCGQLTGSPERLRPARKAKGAPAGTSASRLSPEALRLLRRLQRLDPKEAAEVIRRVNAVDLADR